MRAISADLTATAGGTPMVWLPRICDGLPGRLAAKLEMRNPSGSVIEAALQLASREISGQVVIVTLLADSAERYINTELFAR